MKKKACPDMSPTFAGLLTHFYNTGNPNNSLKESSDLKSTGQVTPRPMSNPPLTTSKHNQLHGKPTNALRSLTLKSDLLTLSTQVEEARPFFYNKNGKQYLNEYLLK